MLSQFVILIRWKPCPARSSRLRSTKRPLQHDETRNANNACNKMYVLPYDTCTKLNIPIGIAMSSDVDSTVENLGDVKGVPTKRANCPGWRVLNAAAGEEFYACRGLICA